jgi:ArsR family transcriptional regulator
MISNNSPNGSEVMCMSTATDGEVDAAPTEDDHQHGTAPLTELPAREILDTAGDILRALAAPVRIAIVLQLRESARCVHELVDAVGVPQPLVSQHLRILKAAGVVAGERSGREVLYRLVDHHLAHIVVAAVTHAGEDRP